MKKQKPLRVMFLLIGINIVIGTYLFSSHKIQSSEVNKVTKAEIMQNRKQENPSFQEEKAEETEENIEKKEEKVAPVENSETKEVVLETAPVDPTVYDGLTMQELGAKLDRSLYANLSGYGSTFARLSIEYNMDPYLVVAIVLHETGCKWGCSYLVKNCNNIGGMKGNPSCAGAYRSFETLEIGIDAYIKNLYYNYYRVGLTTPETMNSKYAESKDWAEYVNKYIEEIKAK